MTLTDARIVKKWIGACCRGSYFRNSSDDPAPAAAAADRWSTGVSAVPSSLRTRLPDNRDAGHRRLGRTRRRSSGRPHTTSSDRQRRHRMVHSFPDMIVKRNQLTLVAGPTSAGVVVDEAGVPGVASHPRSPSTHHLLPCPGTHRLVPSLRTAGRDKLALLLLSSSITIK